MDSEWTTSGGNYEVQEDDSEAEGYQKKVRGGRSADPRRVVHESNIVIWARRIPPRVATITENDDDKNGDDTRDDRGIHEKSLDREIKEWFYAWAKQRGGKRYERGRETKGKKKKKRAASLSLEQNMSHVTSRGTIRPTDRVQAAGTSIRRYSC